MKCKNCDNGAVADGYCSEVCKAVHTHKKIKNSDWRPKVKIGKE